VDNVKSILDDINSPRIERAPLIIRILWALPTMVRQEMFIDMPKGD
jgi:hypothetical protein